MADFNIFLKKTFDVEKGLSTDRKDRGNYNGKGQFVGTNHGISAKTLEAYLKRSVTSADMRSLTKLTAAKIYKTFYWDSIFGDRIYSQDVANILGDHAVNFSPQKASKLVYRVLNLQYGLPVAPKSILTDTIITKINTIEPENLFNTIKDFRIKIYLKGKNVKGQLNRMKQFVYKK